MSFVLRMAGRELRSHKARFALLALCTALGVVAFTATAGFSSSVREALRLQARELLGAELVLSSVRALPDALVTAAVQTPGIAAQVLVTDTVTVAQGAHEGRPQSRLVEVRAADDAYPLLGALVTEPARTVASLGDGLFVEAPLARAWGLRATESGRAGDEALVGRGEALRLGGRVLPIRAIVTDDSGREASAFTLGPRLYVSRRLASELGLVSAQSRMNAKLLLRLAPGASPGATRRALQRLAASGSQTSVRVQTFEDPPGNLVRPVQNLNLFLDQIGLATLLLCVLGGWMAMASYLRGRVRDVAVLRCLGAAPGAPTALFGVVALAVTTAAIVVGVAGGVLLGAVFPALLGSFLPRAVADVRFFLPPGLELAAAGAMILLLSLPSLATLQHVSPLSILRPELGDGANAASTPGLRWLGRGIRVGAMLAAVGLGVWLVWRRAPSGLGGLAISGALLVLGAVLIGANAGLVLLLRRLQHRLPLATRLAACELGARRSLSGLTMGVLGAAVFLALIAQFTRDDLLTPLREPQTAGGRPNFYFIDVQPDQEAPVRALLRAESHDDGLHAPVVRARLSSIAGVPVQSTAPAPRGPGEVPDGEGDRAAASETGMGLKTREQNLTYRDELSAGEELVAGSFWRPGDADAAQWSLEARFAQRIGARLGDELVFDLQGVPVRGRVTSLRKVTWQNLRPNFFIVAPPALLREAPRVSFLAALVPEEAARERLQQAVTARFPNVTVIDATFVARRLTEVLETIAGVTQLLAYLMLASSLAVLGASVVASRARRARDMAILRTLGARGGLLARSLIVEFALIGGLGGGLGAALAYGAAQLYVGGFLDLPSRPSPTTALLAVALSLLLSLLVGAVGTWRVLRAKPLATLRGD